MLRVDSRGELRRWRLAGGITGETPAPRLGRGTRIARLCGAAVLVISVCAVVGCEKTRASGSPEARKKKVLVLGCDGMEPKLVRRMIDDGRLPHFAKLEKQGGFVPLETSIPPQSPVAWSNFITGAGPGVHGIFDFIHRDPAAPEKPYFSTNKMVEVDDGDDDDEPFPIAGGYGIPRKTLENRLMRRGTPFWDHLDSRGIPVQMYRLPANYPPSPSKDGNMSCLSGMGVPDAHGTQGEFQHFTSKPRSEKTLGGGRKMWMRLDAQRQAYIAKLHGPPNEFRVPKQAGSLPEEMIIEIAVYRDPTHDVAKIVFTNEGVGGNEEVRLVLNVGEWSAWHEVRFLKTPLGHTFPTMVRFYLQSVRPDINLYVTPLNFVPTEPAAHFCVPDDFVKKIGRAIGPFYTQGFAEDFKARDLGVFDDAEYKIQADIVLAERFKILDFALDRFEGGMLFFYFSSTDLQAHIFFWDGDEQHPVRLPEDAKKYQGVVEDVYVQMDEALGRCMARIGDDATVIVMSDHGFCNFRRGFGLCTWLRDEGYFSSQHGLINDVDWSKTRAYGLGLNGLYVNLKGRERDGIVEPADRDALLNEITEKLLAFRDPKNGRPVIKRVYRTDEWYSGPEAANAPDLIVGYDRDYRASWKTCLGEFDASVMTDNKKAWSADHCIAHDVVPGILLCNKKITAASPALIDVAPTILSEFGVPHPTELAGKSFLGGSSN